MKNEEQLLQQWRDAWPQALAVWSPYTRLRDPLLCVRQVAAGKEGLAGSFAMIRLLDQSVVIDLETTERLGLQAYAVEILAHEIGHHVMAPGSVSDQFRLLARMRPALPTLERHAPMVANLYTDLFINDRLHRQAGLRMPDIYVQLAKSDSGSNPGDLWRLYMRIYEHLWKLDPGTLTPRREAVEGDNTEADAWLGARLIRVYASDWLLGAAGFATLLLPYLAADTANSGPARYLHDTASAARGCEPAGLDIEDGGGAAVHPSEDPAVTGTEPVQTIHEEGSANGQAHEPFEYGEILRAAGIDMSDHDIAVRYYRQRALPHLVRFPRTVRPETPEPQMEGLDPWSIGDPFDEIDWLQTLLASPRPIPGVTTMRRAYGREPARRPRPMPTDLDMYVDSSGSMPNPQVATSYLALAGAIIALSALRVGARVKVTLWSAKNEVLQTAGFVQDEEAILRVLTGFFGGGTDFPIHCLRDTFPASRQRPTHILMISDSGITTMFGQDEQGNSGWDVSARALERGAAGGTMALNIAENWASTKWYDQLKQAQQEQGWQIHAIEKMDGLLAFAQAFSRHHYSKSAP